MFQWTLLGELTACARPHRWINVKPLCNPGVELS